MVVWLCLVRYDGFLSVWSVGRKVEAVGVEIECLVLLG